MDSPFFNFETYNIQLDKPVNRCSEIGIRDLSVRDEPRHNAEISNIPSVKEGLYGQVNTRRLSFKHGKRFSWRRIPLEYYVHFLKASILLILASQKQIFKGCITIGGDEGNGGKSDGDIEMGDARECSEGSGLEIGERGTRVAQTSGKGRLPITAQASDVVLKAAIERTRTATGGRGKIRTVSAGGWLRVKQLSIDEGKRILKASTLSSLKILSIDIGAIILSQTRDSSPLHIRSDTHLDLMREGTSGGESKVDDGNSSKGDYSEGDKGKNGESESSEDEKMEGVIKDSEESGIDVRGRKSSVARTGGKARLPNLIKGQYRCFATIPRSLLVRLKRESSATVNLITDANCIQAFEQTIRAKCRGENLAHMCHKHMHMFGRHLGFFVSARNICLLRKYVSSSLLESIDLLRREVKKLD